MIREYALLTYPVLIIFFQSDVYAICAVARSDQMPCRYHITCLARNDTLPCELITKGKLIFDTFLK